MSLQVGDGNLDFIPTPAESRALIGSAYRVPYTLLIRFENDAIDETPDMNRILSSANPAGENRTICTLLSLLSYTPNDVFL